MPHDTKKTFNVPESVETRQFAEFRVDQDEEEVTIEGHAATFNEPYTVWDFEEQIAPGAFEESIAQDDIRALLNHDPNILLGRNRSGTLRLEEDDVGLATEIDLPRSREDVREAIERGDLDQMSFGFEVLEEKWESFDEDRPDLRTIQKAKLWDVSPVTFPANENTDVAIQRHQEFRSNQKRDAQPETREKLGSPRAELEFEDTEPEEEQSWGDVDLSFEAFRDGYFRANPDVESPDEEIESWDEAPQAMRDWISARGFLGNPDADTFDEGSAYEAVNPTTNQLNEGGLQAAISRAGQESGESLDMDTAEQLQENARALLEEHFPDEEEDDERSEGVDESRLARLKRRQRQVEATVEV